MVLDLMRLFRAADYESGGQEFESLRARHSGIRHLHRMLLVVRSGSPLAKLECPLTVILQQVPNDKTAG